MILSIDFINISEISANCKPASTELLIEFTYVRCTDQSQKEDPAVFQLVKGSVEEVKLKGHEQCLKLTSTQNGEKVIFLSFTNAKEYEQWLRRCKKVSFVYKVKSGSVDSSLIGCLHDRANIEQLARRSMVISMLIRRAGDCNWKAYITHDQL